MKLSPVVSRYFDVWINNNTWDSGHRNDRERFYRFVKAVARYSRKTPLPGDIRELIIQRWRKRRVTKHLQKNADEFSSLYQTLIEYEGTGDFPNGIIEQTNILRYYDRLIRRYEIVRKGKRKQEMPSDDYIDRSMTSKWGLTWRKQLNDKVGYQFVSEIHDMKQAIAQECLTLHARNI